MFVLFLTTLLVVFILSPNKLVARGYVITLDVRRHFNFPSISRKFIGGGGGSFILGAMTFDLLSAPHL